MIAIRIRTGINRFFDFSSTLSMDIDLCVYRTGDAVGHGSVYREQNGRETLTQGHFPERINGIVAPAKVHLR